MIIGFRTAFVVAALLVVLVTGFWFLHSYRTLGAEVDFRTVDYSGSAVCTDCHGERHESWYRTFHRTMTQEASAGSVQGDFSGQNLDYQGVRVSPVREGGHYYFEYIDPETGTQLNRIRIHRTVGSNRYQQYLTRLPEDGTYVRLQYLWHNGDRRWVHMNAAFLGPDGKDFNQHVAIWNQNCIFCHNTGPQPRMNNYDELLHRARSGEPVNVSRDARFDSQVAELGIACETCHGPGQEHADRANSLGNRLIMRLIPGQDTSVINPVRLAPDRASHVCAQCHAQRAPISTELLLEWMDSGPTYRPGDDLYDHVEPLHQHSAVPAGQDPELFSQRFWNDGTPRLSAYEYQGLRTSACYQQADLTCMDCHTMHAGDPAGQITERNRGNTPCLRCHQQFRSESALTAHSRHDPEGPGSRCYDCHMPQLNYGVMTIHRSHYIELPDADRDATAGRPNACLNCHQDQSFQWAARQLSQWPEPPESGVPVVRFDGVAAEQADIAIVLAGDPVQKAVAAWRAGQPDHALTGRKRAWVVPWLLEAMADIYPATRRFASQSVQAILADWPDPNEVAPVLARLEAFDFLADDSEREAQRRQVVVEWRALDKSRWPAPPARSGLLQDFTLPAELRDRMTALGRRQDKQISIGE